jgi:hypothetical protein
MIPPVRKYPAMWVVKITDRWRLAFLENRTGLLVS